MTDASGIAANRLQSFISRIERLEEEKQAIADDIKEVYAEAKSSGFDTKIMRQVVRLRKMDRQQREEQEQLREVYMQALGDLADTPLGQASAPKVKPEKGDGRVDGDGGTVFKAPTPHHSEPTADLGPPPTRAPSPAEQLEALKASPPRSVAQSLDAVKQQMRAAG